MLRMIDRHAVQQMLTAGVRIGEVARYFEVSRRTIERIRKEPAVEGAEGAVARWKRGVGRPPVPATVRERMRALIAEDPEEAPLEVLRWLREEGHRLGGEHVLPAVPGGAGGAIQGADGALRGIAH
jgi:transposase-like protein